MRNGRLLGVAVSLLVLALAAPAFSDMCVLSIIVDPVNSPPDQQKGVYLNTWAGGPSYFYVTCRVWGDAGIGSPPTSMGLSAFWFNVEGGIDWSMMAAPLSEYDYMPTTPPPIPKKTDSAFADSFFRGEGPMGLKGSQQTLWSPGGGAVPDDVANARVYQNMGIAGGFDDYITWDADVIIALGQYSGNPEEIAVTRASDILMLGLLSDTGAKGWGGPGNEETPSTIVVQTLFGEGNGGAAPCALTGGRAMIGYDPQGHIGAPTAGLPENGQLFGGTSEITQLDIEGEFATMIMYYNEADIPEGVPEDSLRLYWYDEIGLEWLLAGNTSNIQDNPAAAFVMGDPTDVLGDWGLNMADNYVWANVDHASDFGIAGVPEPGTMALLGLGAMGLLARRRRRS